MLFPKTKEKKKRMRHPASILHDKNSRTSGGKDKCNNTDKRN